MSEQMHRPTAEHRVLQELAGEWRVRCEYFVGPDRVMTTEATDTATMLGEFWLVGDFRSEMMGRPFRGQATLGYDPAREKWVSTWIDSMTPFLFSFEGTAEDGGKLMTFSGKGPHPDDGSPVDYRTREEQRPDGSRVFEMWCKPPDAPEFQIFRYTYERA